MDPRLREDDIYRVVWLLYVSYFGSQNTSPPLHSLREGAI